MSEMPPPGDPWQLTPPPADASQQPPPSPWAGQPTSAWAPPQGPPAQSGTDGFAIASLILGIVPVCAGVLGIVFGIISLNRIKKTGQGGRGLAIGGICAGSAWIVLLVVVAVIGGFDDEEGNRDSSGRITSSSTISVAALRAGDCLASVPGGTIRRIDVVPCRQSHEAEVFYDYTLESGDYPGDAQVKAEVSRRCLATIDAYVGTGKGTSHWDVKYLRPIASHWAADRHASCLLTALTGESTYGTARGHGAGPGPTPDPELPPGQVSGTVAPADLVTGNCVTSSLDEGVISTLELGPCAKPHDSEVFDTFDLPAGRFPGDKQSEALVLGHCRKVLPGFVGAPAGHTGYSLFYFYPQAAQWAEGDRKGTCLLEDPDGRKLTSEAKGHGRHR